MKNNKKGFIAIIALAIFMLLAGFGTMMARTSINILNNISDAKKQYKAEDIANSVFEYVRYEMGQHEAGWSMAVGCVDGNCEEAFLEQLGGEDPNVKIDIEIKGMNITPDGGGGYEIEESFNSTEITSGTILDEGAAYTVPTPGEGTAGERCAQYTPTKISGACVNSSASVSATMKTCTPECPEIDDGKCYNNGIQYLPTIDQINYSCNWNKLSFGSSGTARVVIPLYYENDNGDIVNPFKDGNITNYALRVRTPCKPCAADNTNVQPYERKCATNQDETICADDERYKFDGYEIATKEVDSEVMKWQIQGTCDPDYDSTGNTTISSDVADYTEACGFLPVVSYDSTGTNDVFPEHSAITEFRVAYGGSKPFNDLAQNDDSNFKVLYKDPNMQSQNSKVGGKNEILFDIHFINGIKGVLARVHKPSLILKLENPLISVNDKVIPYLEYQFVTIGSPVSDSKTTTTAKVTVNGSTIKKTMTIDNQSQLIDFAVQN